MMKKLLLAVSILVLSGNSVNAQFFSEVFTTSKYARNEILWSKPLSDSSKISVLNFTRFQVNYSNNHTDEFFNYSTLNYDLGKGFAVTAGGFITDLGFTPIFALNYFFTSETWFINITLEMHTDPNAEVFSVFQYRPKINDQLKLFSQLIALRNFNFKTHNFSEQNLRLGLDYRTFQFGVGLDFRQSSVQEEHSIQSMLSNGVGLFVRKEF